VRVQENDAEFCERCRRDAHEKCLDRGFYLDGAKGVPVCACKCWAKSGEAP
jgi:hypothetical protein